MTKLTKLHILYICGKRYTWNWANDRNENYWKHFNTQGYEHRTWFAIETIIHPTDNTKVLLVTIGRLQFSFPLK